MLVEEAQSGRLLSLCCIRCLFDDAQVESVNSCGGLLSRTSVLCRSVIRRPCRKRLRVHNKTLVKTNFASDLVLVRETGHSSAHIRSAPLIARSLGPTWVPTGADRTQVGPMLATWVLISGSSLVVYAKLYNDLIIHFTSRAACIFTNIWTTWSHKHIVMGLW